MSENDFYIDFISDMFNTLDSSIIANKVKEYFQVDIKEEVINDYFNIKPKDQEICLNNMFKEFYE